MKYLDFSKARCIRVCCVLLAGCALVSCAQEIVSPSAVNACDGPAALVNPAASTVVAGSRPGIGGTGISVAKGGVGGTGIDKGGLGGTGIVGIITGFASICVNGVEVHYGPNTPVTSNGVLNQVGQLSVGQVVLVNAQGRGRQLAAQSISALYAVVGPLQTVDANNYTAQVMGQKLFNLKPEEVKLLQPGQWVQVSGHRLANGEISVSSLQLLAPQAQAQINGRITRIDASAIAIEGTRVAIDTTTLPTGAAVGMELSVSGVWNGTQLQAQQLELEPTRRTLGLSERVVLQGYVQALRGKQLQLGHSLVTLGPDAQISGGDVSGLEINQQVQITGRRDSSQNFTADRVDVQSKASESGGNRGKGRGGSRTEDNDDGSKSRSSGSGSGSSGSGSSGSGSSGSGTSGSGSSGSGSSGSGGGRR